jgi:hypothetical protein
MRHRTVILLGCAFLAGCASHAGPIGVAPIDGDKVVEADYLPPDSTLLQRVTVIQCYNQITSEAPNNNEMLALLKQKTASVGGNLLRRVQYQDTGILNKCFLAGGKIATGIAYRGTWRSF